MATIDTTILNPLHFNKYNFQLPAKYHHKDMFDDWFHNRGNQYVMPGTYYQKWQTTDAPPIQAITNGLGVINVDVYTCTGSGTKLYQTNPMNIVADAAVKLPYIKSNFNLDFSAFTEGIYFVVLSCNGIPLRISELLDIQTDHDRTLLYEYSHTTNKYNFFWAGLTPMIRIESMLLDWYDDSSFQSYTDELADNELLDGIPVQKRMLQTELIPDWLRIKLNYILLLNRTSIEGIRYSRTPEGKIDKVEYPGTNLKSYKIELSRAINTYGLGTDGGGANDIDDLTVIWTLDGKAWGLGDGSELQIETTNT